MASKKTEIIRYLFEKRFDHETGVVSDPVVTFEDIAAAIGELGSTLSTANLANFWKDLTRNDLANAWPEEVRLAGYWGQDAIGFGERASFRFVAYDEALHRDIELDLGSPRRFAIQTLSMPQAMKALSRRDENRLTQVAVQLGIVEAHFAFVSPTPAMEVNFLQTGVKLSAGECDAVFHVQGVALDSLVSVEAKGKNERFNRHQLARAADALKRAYGDEAGVAYVIPFLLKVVGPGEILTVEFEPVADAGSALVQVAAAIFELRPQVPGVF